MSEEPAENISGGDDGGGIEAAFPTGDPDTRTEAVVDALGERYWQKTYGGQAAFECLVRTILSQNTSDVASKPAHESLMERYGGGDLVAALADAEQSTLAETIASAGLYNQKSEVIIDAAVEIRDAFGDSEAFDSFVKDGDPGEVRKRLLDIHGVGPKTADCVLLFAGGRGGVFPVKTNYSTIGFILQSGV